MKIFRFLLPVMIVVAISSCKNEKSEGNFRVSGKINNSKETKIYLEEIPMATMQRRVVDSATLDDKGNYDLSATTTESTVFNVRLGQGQFPIASLINDGKSVTLNATYKPESGDFPDQTEIKGSVASQKMKDFMLSFNTELEKLFFTNRKADSLREAPDSVLLPLFAEQQRIAGNLKTQIMDAIAKSDNAALAMFELGYYQSTANNTMMGVQPLTNEEVTKIVSDLSAKYPEHAELARIKTSLSQQMQRDATASLWSGKVAPDFSLPDMNGKQVSLNSLKGKYVLVDFWASWCKPCRMENPVVVEAFNKYKNKNFTILGVSLDEKKELWQKAVKDDGLTWTHVSDLKGWESSVVSLYGFGELGIPYNVLLDPDGKVIAERLRGDQLQAKLAEFIK